MSNLIRIPSGQIRFKLEHLYNVKWLSFDLDFYLNGKAMKLDYTLLFQQPIFSTDIFQTPLTQSIFTLH